MHSRTVVNDSVHSILRVADILDPYFIFFFSEHELVCTESNRVLYSFILPCGSITCLVHSLYKYATYDKTLDFVVLERHCDAIC